MSVTPLNPDEAREVLTDLYTARRRAALGRLDADTAARETAIQDKSAAAETADRSRRDALAASAARTADNLALASERRGDGGGVAASQARAAGTAASRQRQSLDAARVRLASDTARQLRELRVKGEYQKADAALRLTQSQLRDLAVLERWLVKNEELGMRN